MLRKLSCVAAVAGLALLIAASASGQQPVVLTDDEAAAANRAQAIEKMQQSLESRSRELNQQQSTTGYPPDAIDRAVSAQGPVTERAIDDHFRYDPAELPTPASASTSSSSGNEVEWPQIGVGFGIGMLLMLGVGLVLRYTRARPLAH
jgi:hypothetical protein